MRKLLYFIILFILLAATSFKSHAEEKESAYERVMRTQTIRCGYVVWSPMFMKDPNTGKLSGIFYEYTEAVAKALDMKVEWVEETTPAAYVEALQARRFDMLCSADWPNASRGKYLDYVDPIFYMAVVPFARTGDTRFDHNPAAINDPSVTISVIDGEMSSIIAHNDFPQAKLLESPQMADASQLLINVENKKADLTITALTTGLEFNKNNPGKTRQIPMKQPLRLFPNTLSLPLGEDKLRQMMNTVTRELLYNGTIDRIIDKYEEYRGSLYRVNLPYSTSNAP